MNERDQRDWSVRFGVLSNLRLCNFYLLSLFNNRLFPSTWETASSILNQCHVRCGRFFGTFPLVVLPVNLSITFRAASNRGLDFAKILTKHLSVTIVTLCEQYENCALLQSLGNFFSISIFLTMYCVDIN